MMQKQYQRNQMAFPSMQGVGKIKTYIQLQSPSFFQYKSLHASSKGMVTSRLQVCVNKF